jgi:hypothetical protein
MVDVADDEMPKVRLVGFTDVLKPGMMISICAECESAPEVPITLNT